MAALFSAGSAATAATDTAAATPAVSEGIFHAAGAPSQISSAGDVFKAYNFANQLGGQQQQPRQPQQQMPQGPVAQPQAQQFAQGLNQGPNGLQNLHSFMQGLMNLGRQ